MTGSKNCPKCGGPLVAGALEGLCPKCLGTLSFSLEDAHSSAKASSPNTPSRVRYFGDYELLAEIARGGSGVVYKARQVSLNRLVAVKMLLLRNLGREEFVRRFKAEAEAAALLQHPNIVRIHEVGEHEGQHYFSMDYVEGQSLAERARDNPLPPALAADYVRMIASAIHYAHQRGILHRDLKPSNILIDAQDQPRITDFGLAKRLDEDQDLTLTGQVMGTPHYMAPEQAKGLRGEITVATDFYGLGAILYYLLTGQSPFMADSMERVLHRVVNDEPVAPHVLNPSAPRDLETVCLKCMQKEPAKRYATAQAVGDDLARFRRGEPVQARRVSVAERLWRWCRRRPAIAGLIVALHLVLAAGLAGVLWQWGRAKRLAAEARLAQRETTTNLWHSYLAQARANRFSGRPGRRFDSLDVLAKAAAIKSGPEPRDEAVAALALVDARRIFKRTNTDAEPVIVAFDPERSRYAVAMRSGEVSLRVTEDSSELFRLPSVGAAVSGIQTFSGDGKLLLVVYLDKIARVWDLMERRVRISALTKVVPVAFSAVLTFDGQFLVSADGQGDVRCFDVGTGSEVTRIAAAGPADFVQATRKGDRLATGKFGLSEVEVFAVPSGQRLATFVHPPSVRDLAWDAGGRLLASIGEGRDIRIWDVETGAEHCHLVGHNEDIEDVVFGQSERLVISTGWDGTILWNHETGERLLTLPDHGGRVTLSEDGRWLYRQPFGEFTYELWELAAGSPVRTYGSNGRRRPKSMEPRASAFSPDSRLVADADLGWLKMYEPATGRELASLRISPAFGMAFDQHFNLWLSGPHGLQFIRGHFESSDHVAVFGPPEFVGVSEPMWRLRMSLDGSTVAVGAVERCRVFDVESRREIFATPTGSGGSFLALAPDGKRLASSRWGAAHVDVWDVTNGTLLTRLQAEAYLTASAEPAFSPDGKWLFTAGHGGCALWETSSWAQRWSRPRLEPDLWVAGFSPDGSYVLQRDQKSLLRILASGTGELLGVLELPRGDHPDGITFSPDGAYLAEFGTGSRELVVWHLSDLRQRLSRLGLDWDLPPFPQTQTINLPQVSVRVISDSVDGHSSLPLPTGHIPSRAPNAPAALIDLSAHYNHALTDPWFPPSDSSFTGLPVGVVHLAGTDFDVRGVIQLAGSDIAVRQYPRRVVGIRVGRLCGRLHFLHATRRTETEGTQIGSYQVRYSDGLRRQMPLWYGRNIGENWLDPTSPVPFPDPIQAWVGPKAGVAKGDLQLRLFKATWQNPRPDVPIESIDFESEMTECEPFLIAITAEP